MESHCLSTLGFLVVPFRNGYSIRARVMFILSTMPLLCVWYVHVIGHIYIIGFNSVEFAHQQDNLLINRIMNWAATVIQLFSD